MQMIRNVSARASWGAAVLRPYKDAYEWIVGAMGFDGTPG
jgi:hypothetical protein